MLLLPTRSAVERREEKRPDLNMEVSVNLTKFVPIPDRVGSDHPSDDSSSQAKAYATSQCNVPSASTKDLPSELSWPATCALQMLAAKEELESEMELLSDKLVSIDVAKKSLQVTKNKLKSVKKKADQHTKTEKPQTVAAKNDTHKKKENAQTVQANTDQDSKTEKRQNLPAENGRDGKKGKAHMVQAKTARGVKSPVVQPEIQQDSEKEKSHVHLKDEKCKRCRRTEWQTKKRSRGQMERRDAPETFGLAADFLRKELIQACEMLAGLCRNTISEYPNMEATFMWCARTHPFRARFYLRMAELSFLLSACLSQLLSALIILTDTAVSTDVMEIDPKYVVINVMNLSYTVTLFQFTFRDMYSKCVLCALPDDIQGNGEARQTAKEKQTGRKSRIAAVSQHLELALENINVTFQKINAIPSMDKMPASSNTELQPKEAKARFVVISSKLKTFGNKLISLVSTTKYEIRKKMNPVQTV
jgi:hypothetical protein